MMASTRVGEIGSEIVVEPRRWLVPAEQRRFVHAYYALEVAGMLVGLGVAARVAPLVPNLVIEYLLFTPAGPLGYLVGVGGGLLTGIVPPWVARSSWGWSLRTRATRRYPALALFPEIIESRQRLDAAIAEMLAAAQAAQPQVGQERHGPTVATDAVTGESSDTSTGSGTGEVTIAQVQAQLLAVLANRIQSLPGDAGAEALPDATKQMSASDDLLQALLPGFEHLASEPEEPAAEAEPSPKWKAAESNAGMIFGLVVGACGGYDASIAGALVLGQFVPALRRLAEPGRLATTVVVVQEVMRGHGVGSSAMRSLAASTVSEVTSLLAGTLVGLGIALAVGHRDPYVIVAVGAASAYNGVGGTGHYLARALLDASIPPGRMPQVIAYYAARAAAVLIALPVGLGLSAPAGDPLVTLLAGWMATMVGGMLAAVGCGIAGILPPWEWTILKSGAVRAWATRAYDVPRRAARLAGARSAAQR
jgi:hypothetical protein